MSETLRRLGADAGIAGAILTMVAGIMHPKGSSDVGTVEEWMLRVSASDTWILVHLLLLLGAVLLLPASYAIAHAFPEDRARAWGRLGYLATIVATGVALTTFLFDGAVVKNISELWEENRATRIDAAALLATEAGFVFVAGLQLTTGLVAFAFGIAGVTTRAHPRWLGGMALVAAVCALMPGTVHYLVGSQTWSVSLVYVSTALLAIWFLIMSQRILSASPGTDPALA